MIAQTVKKILKSFKINISKEVDFEKVVLQHLLKSVQEPIIFDIGAYVGEKTGYYRSIFPNSRVYCFEPFPDSFNKLHKNMASQKRVILNNIALSNYSGEADFSIKSGFDQGNSLLQSSEDEYGYMASDIMQETAKIKVPVNTLDKFVQEQNLKKIDLLKLDIQGAELLALEGAKDLFEKHTIDFIFLEGQFLKMYKDQAYFHDICKYLYDKDYRFYNFFGGQSIGFQLREVNALFYRKDLVVSL